MQFFDPLAIPASASALPSAVDQGQKLSRVRANEAVRSSLEMKRGDLLNSLVKTGYAVKKEMTRESAHFFAARLSKLPYWKFKTPRGALKIYRDVQHAWKQINLDWKLAQSANAGKAQPTSERSGERQKKEARV
jgi:hypothetical protein